MISLVESLDQLTRTNYVHQVTVIFRFCLIVVKPAGHAAPAHRNPTVPFAASTSFAGSKPIPSLKTRSTFSMSVMFDDGSPFDHVQVGRLPGRDRADVGRLAEERGAVERRHADRFERRETGLHEELDFALVAVAGDRAAVSGRVGPGQQKPPAFAKSRSKAISFAERRPQRSLRGRDPLARRRRYSFRASAASPRARADRSARRRARTVSNTGSVDVTATCFSTRWRISDWISGPFSSSFASASRAGARRAVVRLLSGREFGVHDEPVLEVVDAEVRRLREADTAEVARHFEAVCVCGLDAAFSSARVMYMYALNEVAPSRSRTRRSFARRRAR